MTTRTKRLIRNFVLELLVYGVLLAVYFLTVLRYLDEPLYNLFNQNLWVYAGAALLLIVVQAVVLEWVTSFLIARLGLEMAE
jgi:Na+/H+-dicarboxylate symporter